MACLCKEKGMKKLNNSRTLLLILIIGAASFAIQACTPSTASTPAGQPTDPTNPEQITTVQDTGIYKALTALGFDISTEKVEAIDGQYQPKMGDITALSYRQVDQTQKKAYNYTLDEENSNENNLVYKGKYVNEFTGKVYDYENSTITVNKEEKSVDIYDTRSDVHRKFTLNDDGTLTAVLESGDAQQMTIGENKSIYGVRGETFADIKIKLAE